MPNKFEKLADGHYLAEGELGEHFTGSADEIIPTILDAQQNTKKAYQQEKAARATAEQRAAQLEQELAASKQQHAQSNAAPYTASQSGQLTEEEQKFADWWDDIKAKQRGLKGGREELRALEVETVQTAQEMRNNLHASIFTNQHPEYPGTPEAINTIAKIFEERGWAITAENMEAAHLIAVDRHRRDPSYGYEPLAFSEKEAVRTSAPPMLRTSNPEMASPQGNDPYAMDMEALRKAAIAQELARK